MTWNLSQCSTTNLVQVRRKEEMLATLNATCDWPVHRRTSGSLEVIGSFI
jgi:hypothetical protein